MLAQYEESIRITRQAALEAAETDSIITASGKRQYDCKRSVLNTDKHERVHVDCDVSSIDSLLQTPRASTRRRDQSEAANPDHSTAAGAWASGVGAAGGEDEGGADRAWARRRDASRAVGDAADADGEGSVSRVAACT